MVNLELVYVSCEKVVTGKLKNTAKNTVVLPLCRRKNKEMIPAPYCETHLSDNNGKLRLGHLAIIACSPHRNFLEH